MRTMICRCVLILGSHEGEEVKEGEEVEEGEEGGAGDENDGDDENDEDEDGISSDKSYLVIKVI